MRVQSILLKALQGSRALPAPVCVPLWSYGVSFPQRDSSLLSVCNSPLSPAGYSADLSPTKIAKSSVTVKPQSLELHPMSTSC